MTGDELDAKLQRSVPINGHWRIGWNPFGSGLVLLVDRGISCENHTQVFSFHATNTPELEDVEEAVNALKPEFEHAIDSFVDFMRAAKHALPDENRESIAAIFSLSLLGKIVGLSETNMHRREARSGRSL